MLKNILGILLATIFVLNGSASAMTFSQPVKIGEIRHINMGGGFVFRKVSKNDGVLSKRRGLGGAVMYDKGIARFGNEKNELYLHYRAGDHTAGIKEYAKFGANDIRNTVNIDILEPEIFVLSTDQDITLYLIHDDYDIAEDNRYILLGKTRTGQFVKYFSTYELREKYFGDYFGCAFEKIHFTGDSIIIPYTKRVRKSYNYVKVGEFRFKWDDAAQWFGVEQVVY